MTDNEVIEVWSYCLAEIAGWAREDAESWAKRTYWKIKDEEFFSHDSVLMLVAGRIVGSERARLGPKANDLVARVDLLLTKRLKMGELLDGARAEEIRQELRDLLSQY